MDLNIKACEITFTLDTPIQITREGGLADVTDVLFKKPNRRTGPLFQNLVAMFNRAAAKSISLVKEISSEEEFADAKAKAAAKKSGDESDTDAIKSMQDITFEEVMEEADGMVAMSTAMDFDFEKAFKLFDKMLLGEDRHNWICKVGGKQIMDGMLDKIDYHDSLKMMMVYIAFFGKPAKAGTTKDSKSQPESATPATEV